VDIRETWERAYDAPDDQIELHVPLSGIVDGAAALPAGGRYLIVCAHGVRSLALTEHLRSQGYGEVYSLAGGLAALER
jgi:rhodanese-related sulfurtransferase